MLHPAVQLAAVDGGVVQGFLRRAALAREPQAGLVLASVGPQAPKDGPHEHEGEQVPGRRDVLGGQGAWSEEDVRRITAYRVRHPVPTQYYQPWPVAVALLQQPFVPFSSEEERREYMAELDGQERRIKETRQGQHQCEGW